MKNKKTVILIALLSLLIVAGVVVFLVLTNQKVVIKFDENGGTKVADLKVKKGESVKLPTTTKEEYVFEGWYDGDTKVIDGASFNTNKTLKANWLKEDAKTLTVTFDSDGGSKVASKTIECGSALRLPASPKKDGYKFVNWTNAKGTVFADNTVLKCSDITLKANWEKDEETPVQSTPESQQEVKKEYTCPSGYTLDGTKCKAEGTVHESCPTDSKTDGSLCIKTSDRNDGTRVCKEDTVSYNGKGGLWTGKGDYHFNGAYGKCAYYKWDAYKSKSDCEAAYDQWHKTVWVSDLNACYAEDKMNNYETVCASDYQYYSSDQLKNKFGIYDNGKCLKKVSKVKYCDDGYTLTNNRCIKTIDATVK